MTKVLKLFLSPLIASSRILKIKKKIIFMGHRNENVYTIDISKYEGHDKCFLACMMRVGCDIGDWDM